MATAAAPPVMLHGAQRTAAVNSGVEHLQRVIGDQVRAVHVHMNHQKRSKFEPDEGKAVEISIDAKLDPRIFHPNMNCQKVLSLITGRLDGESADTLTTEYFRMRHDALRAVAEQHFSAARRTTIDPLTGYDSAPWTCVLGEGSRIEVCRAEVPGRDTLFFIAATIDDTPIGADAYAHVEECAKKGMTVGAYLDLPLTRQLRSLAARNACRAVAATAVALGVTIDWSNDLLASEPAPIEAKPLVAEPQVHNEYNIIGASVGANGLTHATLFDNVIDVRGARNGLLYDIDPRSGRILMQARSNSTGRYLFENQAANSFPARAPAGDDETALKLGDARVTWEGKGAGAGAARHANLTGRAPAAHEMRLLAALATIAPGVCAEPLRLVTVIAHLTAPRVV